MPNSQFGKPDDLEENKRWKSSLILSEKKKTIVPSEIFFSFKTRSTKGIVCLHLARAISFCLSPSPSQ